MVEYRLNRSEDAFQELNKKSAALKKILCRIPDEITDRQTFLETIKYGVSLTLTFHDFFFVDFSFLVLTSCCMIFREIASAIKKLLDAVNEVTGFIPGSEGKQQLEQRKRDFVRYSKRFSNTLKEFFREGE